MNHVSARFGSLFRSVALVLALGLLGNAAARAQSDSGDINLVFTGSGSVTATQTATINTYNTRTKHFQTGFASSTGRREFSGSGYVEISSRFARIKLPSQMMPPIRGDNDGWFTIQDFFMNDREITGTIRINALNKPKLRIDRHTGRISIEGGYSDFSGECDLLESNAKRRF